MRYLKTKHERKSFAISVILFALMFILFFFIGLKYFDPPLENGIAINFGTSDFGSGDYQPTEPVASEPEPADASPVDTAEDTSPEEILNQEVAEAPVITSKPKPEKPEVVKPKVEEPKKPVVKQPTPSKNTTDALSSLINGPKSEGKKAEGEGDDTNGGDKGKIDGSIYSTLYAGSGQGNGLDNGNSWGLKGRRLAKQNVVKQNCDEQGKVVVQIWVNREGQVIKARQSKGTDNAAPCLIEAAIKTSKLFSWDPDPNAPQIQVGFIVVNFKLG